MVVRKFFAPGTREALRLVREALGADALILSNRQVSGGVEIMAVAEQDMAAAVATAAPSSSAGAAPAGAPFDPVTTQDILSEVRQLRGMVESQLAGFAWKELTRSSPTQVELVRVLLARGFGARFARALASRLPADLRSTQVMRWVKGVLTANLRCVRAGDDLVSRGGVYALVGPTGVGKTTTVAKLAASCTLQHGASRVALVTTDSYRIGAVDQLRIYGKILGVPVFVARDERDLAATLVELHGRHLVLIDTVGMSQRDRRVAEQAALLAGQGKPVQRLLLLSAVAQGEALEDTVQRYRADGLAGCVLTKVDEALTLGAALDVVARAALPLHYVANGQRVPEDLHLANPLYLVERAFRGEAPDGPFRLAAEDVPLAAAGRAGTRARTGVTP
jgi:flagellar biosynthesis protein FlhF